MSNPDEPPPPGGTRQPTKISPEDAETLRVLNATYDRIAKRIPKDPFTLADPYKGDGWTSYDKYWLSKGTPERTFSTEEAHWQFATFVFRDAEKEPDYAFFDRLTEVDEKLYQRKRQGDDGHVSTRDMALTNSAVARKKISLKDYKNKKDSAPPSAKSIDSANPSPLHETGSRPNSSQSNSQPQPSRKRPLEVPAEGAPRSSPLRPTEPPEKVLGSAASSHQDQPPQKKQKTVAQQNLKPTSSPALKDSPYLRAAPKPKSSLNPSTNSRPSNAKLEALVSEGKTAAKAHETSTKDSQTSSSERPANSSFKKTSDATSRAPSDTKKAPTITKITPEKNKQAKEHPPSEKVASKTVPSHGNPTVKTSKQSSKQAIDSEGTPSSRHGLPPLLSPTILPLPDAPHGLPPMLSPTLPPEIEAELASADLSRGKHTDNSSELSSVSDKMPPPAAPHSSPPPARPITSADHQRRRSLHKDGETQKGIAIPTKKKRVRDMTEESTPAPNNVSTPTSTPSKKVAPSGTYTFMLGKRIINEVSFNKRAASKRFPGHVSATKNGVPGVSISPLTPKTSRVEDASGSVSSKRLKLSKDPDSDKKARSSLNPETPKAMLNGHPKEQVTPQKEADTPGSAKTSAPGGWSDEHKHWSTQGRNLKREVAQELQSIESELPQEQKRHFPPTERLARTAIKGIECLLCYLLAFTAEEMVHKNRRGRSLDLQLASGTWLTLDGIFRMFAKATRPFPHLDGLRLHIGWIIGERIVKCFSTSSLPLVSTDDASKSKQSILPIDASKLQEAFRAKFEYAREARILLPAEVLRKQYSDSWSGQSQGTPPDRDPLPRVPGKWPTDYYLPLSGDTTPVQAVVFARAFLLEWQRKHDQFGSAKLAFRLSPDPQHAADDE